MTSFTILLACALAFIAFPATFTRWYGQLRPGGAIWRVSVQTVTSKYPSYLLIILGMIAFLSLIGMTMGNEFDSETMSAVCHSFGLASLVSFAGLAILALTHPTEVKAKNFWWLEGVGTVVAFWFSLVW